MRKLLLLVIGIFLFASEGSTDIIPRTINFLIFAALLWYLVGDKAIKFFRERRENIAKKFEEVEEKLKESKAKKEALKRELENAHVLAKDIIETAKKEAEIIEENIKKSTQEEIKNLEKQFEEYKELASKKIKQEAIEEFIDAVFKDITITSKDAANIILRKAS